MQKKNITSILLFIAISLSSLNASNVHDFKIKGFHLDLRNEVMTMSSLKEFAGKLAEGGINTLIMEWEDTFPFENHLPIRGRYAYSRDEVKEFTEYCNNLEIDVIPLQQTFGHVEFILRHNRYADLREETREFSQVCPLNPNSVELFSELIDDMISLSTSDYFHIGCDETRLLGSCKECKAFVKKHGVSKLFADYVKKISEMVLEKGKIPVLWADIILKYPEHADAIPKEAIFVDWNYTNEPRKGKEIDKLQAMGFDFWGAAALRSGPDNMYITDWEKHFTNQEFYIPFAREKKFSGMIMTSWSTSGQYSYTWDFPAWDLLHLEEIRNVYPITGFNILLEAYIHSLTNKGLNSKEFIKEYGEKQFGFSKSDSEVFLQLFTHPAYVINGHSINGQPKLSIADVNTMFKKVQEDISQLKPEKNTHEFEHLKLMMDIRENYLDFKLFEEQYNSAGMNASNINETYRMISSIKRASDELDARFIALNSSVLYRPEMEHLNSMRSKKLNDLYYSIKQAATSF